MARITEEMIRKRSEHNECEITTLEELSLHQQDIEKIEHLDRWCKHLKILYLQSNLISKIENVGRLKELEYLNLALNNITKIENLQRCESLQKLDLTVNFVGDLFSIESLKDNAHLQEMFLTGNPCTDYNGYRDFVVATLPQLKWLDGKEIVKSERILALQRLPQLKESIEEQQQQYEQRVLQEKAKDNDALQNSEGEINDKTEYNMEESVPYTPESRTALHKELSEMRQEGKETKERNPHPPKRERRLEKDGRMLNVNEGRYEFTLEEDDEKQCYIVNVACPRFMDTSLIECDVQPTYVRVTIKGKILQLVLPEEVSPDSSNALRSQVTGHLVVTMPKEHPCIRAKPFPAAQKEKPVKEKDSKEKTNKESTKNTCNYLEVSENMLQIVKQDNMPTNGPSLTDGPPSLSSCLSNKTSSNNDNDCTSEDFIDDPDVPPLI